MPNKTAPSTLVRRNLASYIHRASLYRAELIPTEVQIQAATILDARTSTTTTLEGEGFCATVVEICTRRIKREEMVQELLKIGTKGPTGTYRR